MSERINVTLCARCGQFRVGAVKGDQHIVVTFDLCMDEQLTAAGRYIEYLKQEERKEPSHDSAIDS